MSDAAVSVRGLVRSFGGQRAIDGLDFEVAPGEIFGLVGPDGAGKTTTMRILAGVMRADAGQVRIDGVDVVAQPEQVRHRVSYMPQRFALYEDLTVDENLSFFADLFEVPPQVRRRQAARLLEVSGMAPFGKRLAGQLSGGMKQKLGLSCALIHAPRVLLLDEPTTGVDPLSRREFWQLLYQLRAQGVAMVISTAYLDEAERCDRLALLNDGAILHADTPQRLKALLPGAILRIACERPRLVADRAQRCEGVFTALPAGDGVNLHVDDAARRRPALATALADAGVREGDILQVEPGIEDLFIALLERHAPGARP